METAFANPVSHMNATHVPHEDRKHTAQRIAAEMFHQQPDWITFFREVLGVDQLTRAMARLPPGRADELIAGLRSLVDLAAPAPEPPAPPE